MAKQTEGRSTVYNSITSEDKLEQVCEDNLQLEDDFLEYLTSTDRAKSTIKQYKANLHVFWCWNLEFNKNKSFVDLTKREITKFQNHALNVWNWSPSRVRTVKAVMRSLENYIITILDDEYPDYKQIWNKIESPANEAVRKKTVFQTADLQTLLDKLVERKEYDKACMLSLAMNSGRRKAELIRFKVSYFNDENLICNGALYKTPEKVVTKGRGQRGKLLDIYILAKQFKPYLNLWLKQREELGITTDTLFPDYVDGKYVDESIGISTMNSWANTFSRLIGQPFYFHAMRHWFTTSLLEANLPESIVQDIIGWSSSDMLRIYDDRELDSQFDKYFGEDGIKQVKSSSLDNL